MILALHKVKQIETCILLIGRDHKKFRVSLYGTEVISVLSQSESSSKINK